MPTTKVLRERLKQLLSALRPTMRSREASAQIQYLLNEVSDLRMLVRELTARDGPSSAQTRESFTYQWSELSEGKHLIGDPAFERRMSQLLEKYTDLPAKWFAGKRIIDAGCGNGRWSFALSKLGANVTAVDQSASGVAHLQSLLEDGSDVDVRQADLLQPLPFGPDFDLAWCYGVAHHTGNTRLAVEHVAEVVKPGGRLFLMIYGEPKMLPEFEEINRYVQLRRETQFMNFDEKRKHLMAMFPSDLVHGYFDAISPNINDLHRFDEVVGWLLSLGFQNIRRTCQSRNHHLVADRVGS